ncbi:helix-turn-helix transcriptional regulator [Amaricoccus solimangrovi]|uniref:LuxR family transcriptional regulator n=1 Tax=Amaricoccus solimangrovi TaxID=2589815 RepID=A0A501WWB2_9RHOB|nr:autoinducer binding domain-containing protein [Amaricoccus solimangrovi]TPE53738.1 LuxR family transcriptional regulator [Amaricoccus solimangrovi]
MIAQDFQELAPAGFYIALRVGFAFPMVEQNRLPELWVREYTMSGLIVHDPAIAWCYRNDGAARWSELGIEDELGVLELAKAHDLLFGAAVSCRDAGDSGQRSFGIFCRSDREFETEELERLTALLRAEHAALEQPRKLTPAELETLGLVKNGLLMKEIACALGVSESAIKQRLKSARLKLRAKTGTQAAARATMLGMI